MRQCEDPDQQEYAMADDAKNHGPSEESKRKFREALDKKQAHAGRDVSDHTPRSKADGPHAPQTSGAQQMFRRKSG